MIIDAYEGINDFHACYHIYVYFSIIPWKSHYNLKNTLN